MAHNTVGFVPGRWPEPPDELKRQQVLDQLDILDTSAEAAFDHVAKMGLRIFKVPICLVSLIDKSRQWFKACYGLRVDQTGRDVAFCAHAIMPDAPVIFEVPNATEDPRFSNNPLVLGDPNIRYYAGCPLEVDLKNGLGPQKMGTLCIIDTKPRPPMEPEDREAFTNLAAMVVDQLTSRLLAKGLARMNHALYCRTNEVILANKELSSLIDTANAPIFAIDADMRVTTWNRKISEITSVTRDDIWGKDIVVAMKVPPEREGGAVGLTGESVSPVRPLRDDALTAEWQGAQGLAPLDSSSPPDSFSNGRGGDHHSSHVDVETARKALVGVLQKALLGERCQCFDLDLFSKVHCRHVQLQVSAEPKMDADGKIVGVVCVGEEVGMRRRMLEATIKNHALQKTNEAKDTFLACMSHEMRTPLNGLLGMLQLAISSGEELPEKVRRYLKQAQNSGTLLLNLINDVLDIARIEAGNLELQMSTFSLRSMLEHIMALLRPKADEKSLELQLDIEPRLDDLCQSGLIGDSTRLQQVLLNLMWNALKFTGEGHVRLSVRCSTTSVSTSTPLDDVNKVQIIFEVADTGIGLDSVVQAVVFDRFARVTAQRTRGVHPPPESSGAGLGMSICKQLVTLMGGRIWLHSELNKGTRVFVQLGLSIAPPSEEGQGAQVAKWELDDFSRMDGSESFLRRLQDVGRGGADRRNRVHRHILVVEDNDYNVDVCKQMLELLGHTVTVAFNGWEAVSIIVAHDCRHAHHDSGSMPFDLILMDCDMPVMNGFDATRTIRQWERTGAIPSAPPRGAPIACKQLKEGSLPRPPLPIIATTAYAMSGDKDKCFEAGMDDYITKPLALPALRDRITVHCSDTSEKGPGAVSTAPEEVPRETVVAVEAASSGRSSGEHSPYLAPVAGVLENLSDPSTLHDNPLVALMVQHSLTSGWGTPTRAGAPTAQSCKAPAAVAPAAPSSMKAAGAAAPAAPVASVLGVIAAADATADAATRAAAAAASDARACVGATASARAATPAAARTAEVRTAEVRTHPKLDTDARARATSACEPSIGRGTPHYTVRGGDEGAEAPIGELRAVSDWIRARRERDYAFADGLGTTMPAAGGVTWEVAEQEHCSCGPKSISTGASAAFMQPLSFLPPAVLPIAQATAAAPTDVVAASPNHEGMGYGRSRAADGASESKPALSAAVPPACSASTASSSDRRAPNHPSSLQPPPAREDRLLFDLKEMETIFGGNRQLVHMALSRYDLKAHEKLRVEWAAGNFHALGQLAHQLKGATSYICAHQAKMAAARLEQSAKALAVAPTDLLMQEVGDALREVETELNCVTPAVGAALKQLAGSSSPN